MIVLSLFDGISCGYEALIRAGFKIDKYYASEINKYAIQVSVNNHPDIIQLGNINNWKDWRIENPDLIIGGSPCQGFSFAGKQLNFEDQRSKLFFKYVEILRYYKPKFFLLENVQMKKEYQNVISELLGVQPVLIDSALVSAQRRKRLFWCNWEVKQPEDKNILLKDIIHENSWTDTEKSFCVDANYAKGGNLKQYYEKHRRQIIFEKLNECMVPFNDTLKILNKEIEKGKLGYFNSKDSQANRVYYIHDKAVTLLGTAGGGAAKMGQYLFGCITPDRINKHQNGQKFHILTAQDKHGILIEGYIRKLTPIECERLQTLPDNYTKGISNSQRYKTLGNGWTVDIITHIFLNIKAGS